MSTQRFALLLAAGCAGSSALSTAGLESFSPTNLTCEYGVNPLGIDVSHPRLSWQLASAQRGERQSSYRVLVASTRESLEQDHGDLWDSGRIASDQSVHVVYEGRPLRSRERCWWKIRAWDRDGRAGLWSGPAWWEMGLLESNDWQGQWIACRPEEDSPPPLEPAPLFRHEFLVRQPLRQARAYATGLGYFVMSLNGAKVGDHELDPVVSRYDRRIYYVTFDVGPLLRPGTNVVGFMLGTGWFNMHTEAVWGFGQAPWRARPRLLCQIELDYEDGSREVIISDDNWKTALGPVVFDGIRNGETHDARLEQPGWDAPAFDPSSWAAAAPVRSPGGVLTATLMPPIRATRLLDPVATRQVKPGVWLFDLGQNIAGRVRLRTAAPPGTAIKMKQGERLHPDGTVQQKEIARFVKSGELQTDTYICRGGGETETWSPQFVYHGFQYVEVTGLPQAPSDGTLRAEVLHTDFPSAGSFRCNLELLNQIQHATRWSFIGNYHGIPTDCPHREKIGWTGDAHLVAETGLFNFDLGACYTKWIRDFIDEQRPSGQLPGIIPSSGWGYTYGRGPHRERGYGPQWEGALVLIPWYLYLYRGDTRILTQHYGAFQRYLHYLAEHAEQHLIRFGIDDHAPAHTTTPPDEFATGFYYQIARIVAHTAGLLHRLDDQQHYQQLAESIRLAYHQHLFDPETGRYGSGSQTAQSAPLYFNLVAPPQQPRVLSRLIQAVHERNDHLDTGVVGTKFLLNGLAQHGRADVAWQIVSQTNFPSWGDWMRQGANTLWQKWDDSMSRNHVMFGDISAWLFKNVAGIQPDPTGPGFKKCTLRPLPFAGLAWVEADHQSPYGPIRSVWHRRQNDLQLEVTLPPNTTASVHLPSRSPSTIQVDHLPLAQNRDVRLHLFQNNVAHLEIGSGTYHFQSILPDQ